MTNRKLLEQQIIDGEYQLGYETVAHLEILRDHYPKRNEIRFQIIINDGSDHTHESEPSWKICIHAEEEGGLFGGISHTFFPMDIPLIMSYLNKEGNRDPFYSALGAYRSGVQLKIDELKREIRRLEIRQNKVETMLNGHITNFPR